ncbi:MAG: hypothetical protein E7349_07100 [Clostridiales bacterium]|nr:hypothetical protein [Clostridiales bacterium]
MEIYSFYRSWGIALVMSHQDNFGMRVIGLLTGLLGWIVLFVLQGVGLYKMAKNRNMNKKWMCFIPFANVYYMGKMTGDCVMFGRKMKRTSLYAMFVQILLFIIYALQVAMELYLFNLLGTPDGYVGYYVPQWYSEVGTISKFYNDYCLFGDMIIMIADLAFTVLLLVLLMSLFRQYNPKMSSFFAMLSIFVPESRYIIIFALRNKKRIDYEAYIRKKQEEFMRRQQQYRNTYGNPYNPYGNPYNRGYGPYNNPYGNPYPKNNPEGQKQPPKDEPFSEFASDNFSKNEEPQQTETQPNSNNGDSGENFFS